MKSRDVGQRIRRYTLISVATLVAVIVSCRGTDFSGSGGPGGKRDGAGEGFGDGSGAGTSGGSGGGNASGANSGGSADRQAGVGGDVGAGGGVLTGAGDNTAPDYRACAALPVQGKQKYPAKCGFNHVLVIVNDGGTQEMTCCPLKNADMLSSRPGDLFQERAGRCLADEVGVGMINSGRTLIFNTNNPRLYCSRINTGKFSLGPAKRSDYVTVGNALAPELLAIAVSYNALDACVCPLKSVMLGGHKNDNNTCEDECAEILPK